MNIGKMSFVLFVVFFCVFFSKVTSYREFCLYGYMYISFQIFSIDEIQYHIYPNIRESEFMTIHVLKFEQVNFVNVSENCCMGKKQCRPLAYADRVNTAVN